MINIYAKAIDTSSKKKTMLMLKSMRGGWILVSKFDDKWINVPCFTKNLSKNNKKGSQLFSIESKKGMYFDSSISLFGIQWKNGLMIFEVERTYVWNVTILWLVF